MSELYARISNNAEENVSFIHSTHYDRSDKYVTPFTKINLE